MLVVNPHRSPDQASRAGPAPTGFHRRHPAYAVTPLRDAPGLATELGLGAVLVKDETDRLGLPAFKALGASWAVQRALERDKRVRTFVAASAGNHGRAVARFAREQGRSCVVVLPGRASAPRRAAIEGEGATVEVVDGTYEAAVQVATQLADRPGWSLVADVGETPSAADVVDGYNTLFAELEEQLAAPPDLLVVPVGVGSLAAAAARASAGWGAAVLAVEPDDAACLAAALEAGEPTRVPTPGTRMAGMDCAEVSAGAWPDLRAGVAAVVTVGDGQLAAAGERLRSETGVRGGACAAAAIAALPALATPALRNALGLTADSRVVAIATEGETG